MHKHQGLFSTLLDTSEVEDFLWTDGDLKEILEHQLATPVLSEIDNAQNIDAKLRAAAAASIQQRKTATFFSTLNHRAPNPSTLLFIKEFARLALTEKGNLPQEVARVIYVLSILRGRCSGFPRISSLNDISVKREAHRCLTFGWLPEHVVQLMRTLLAPVN